jgi:hypothetical protein
MKVFLIVFAAALAVLGLVGAVAPGKVVKPTRGPGQEISKAVLAVPNGESLILKVDDTSSISPEDRANGESVLVQVAEEQVDSGEFTVCKIQHVGEDGWLRSETTVPLPNKTHAPCRGPVIEEDQAWYKPLVRHEEKKAAKDCEEEQAKASRDYEDSRTEALKLITQAIKSTEQGNSSCTAFYDALASASFVTSPSFIVVLSDGVDTCVSSTPKIPAPAAGVKVMLILLPSKYDHGKNASAFGAFSARKTLLQKIAPWLRVEPPSRDSISGI